VGKAESPRVSRPRRFRTTTSLSAVFGDEKLRQLRKGI